MPLTYRIPEAISPRRVYEMMEKRLDRYAPKGTRRREILDLHYHKVPASEIDRRFGMEPGSAKFEIVDFWKWDRLHRR